MLENECFINHIKRDATESKKALKGHPDLQVHYYVQRNSAPVIDSDTLDEEETHY